MLFDRGAAEVDESYSSRPVFARQLTPPRERSARSRVCRPICDGTSSILEHSVRDELRDLARGVSRGLVDCCLLQRGSRVAGARRRRLRIDVDPSHSECKGCGVSRSSGQAWPRPDVFYPSDGSPWWIQHVVEAEADAVGTEGSTPSGPRDHRLCKPCVKTARTR